MKREQYKTQKHQNIKPLLFDFQLNVPDQGHLVFEFMIKEKTTCVWGLCSSRYMHLYLQPLEVYLQLWASLLE